MNQSIGKEKTVKTYDYIDYALARVLHDSVVKKCFNLSYTECAEMLSPKVGKKVHYHYGLRNPLCNVAEICHALGLPLITAIVRRSNPKSVQQVGTGFYKMACDYRPEYKKMNPEDAWRAEMDRVRSCADWSKLDQYLAAVEGTPRVLPQGNLYYFERNYCPLACDGYSFVRGGIPDAP